MKHPPCYSSDAFPAVTKTSGPRRLQLQSRLQTEGGAEIWLMTLSDLLMLLMIFFVVLFGMALQREKRQAASPMAELKNPAPASVDVETSATLEADLIAALDRERGREDVFIERVADRLILSFPERIVFDPGLAHLKPSARVTLNKVAIFINERPSLLVEVQGHTDDTPISNTRYPSNWELSVDRAMQVSKTLIGLGVKPTQLSVKGFGEYRPNVPNDCDENRLQNRRVEIQFSLPPQS